MRSRKTQLLTIILVFIATLSGSSLDAEPSLSETSEWLTAKLTGLSGSQVQTITCNSGRVTNYTMGQTIKSVSIHDGLLRIDKQFITTGGGDNLYSPIKQSVLRLDEFYATCSVKRLASEAPAPNRLCTSQMTRLPYEINLSGPNNKWFSIWVDDQELAERIGRALENLIAKSGGKKEAF